MSTPPNRPYTKFAFDTEFFEVVGASAAAGGAGLKASGHKTPDEIRQEIYAEGFAAGVVEGQKQAEQQLAQLHATLQGTLAGLETAVKTREDQMAAHTLSLLRLTLHHVLGHAAQHYPEELLEQHIKAVMPFVKADETLVLRIHPAAQAFHEKLKLPQANILGLPMQIIPDASLALTDVSVEWKGGGTESKLAAHWEAINTLLLGAGAAPHPVPPLPTGALSKAEPAAPPEPVNPIRARAAELLGDDDLIDALK